jgi:hypothetical protein
MKKPKPQTRRASSKSSLAHFRQATQFRGQQWTWRRSGGRSTDLVGNGAVGMVEATRDEVGKGHYLGMKYLFEMIGLYPATSPDDAPRGGFAGRNPVANAGHS